MNKEFPQGKEKICLLHILIKMLNSPSCEQCFSGSVEEPQPPSENWEEDFDNRFGDLSYAWRDFLKNFIKKELSAQKSQLIRDGGCEKDGYKGRTPCRH